MNSLNAIYRFDFHMLHNYTGGYSNYPSTDKIVTSNYPRINGVRLFRYSLYSW